MEPKAFYSAREVAEVLSLHEQTVMRLLRSGDIPAGKVGRQWRIAHAALEKMLGTRIEPPEDGPMKDTGDLTSWTDQDLLDLAEEAFAAGDEAQVALVASELHQRGKDVEAEDIESRLDKRLGQTRFTTRCRAFSGEGVREHRILIEADGSVLVWDEVAGSYTRCHALSAGQQARLRKLARDWSR